MKHIEKLEKFFSQESANKLKESLANGNIRTVHIGGLYGSSKALSMSSSFVEGVNIVVMDNREEAQFLTNDLYNLTEEENVFYFPT